MKKTRKILIKQKQQQQVVCSCNIFTGIVKVSGPCTEFPKPVDLFFLNFLLFFFFEADEVDVGPVVCVVIVVASVDNDVPFVF